MAVWGVHLELVEDYTTESFIATFHRFTARRGHCKELHSDQGTNFIGADAELRKLLQEQGSGLRKIIAHMVFDVKFPTESDPVIRKIHKIYLKLLSYKI